MLPFRPEWTWEQWQWRGALHFQKTKHYWNLAIRLFSVISRILVGDEGVVQSVHSTAPADWVSLDRLTNGSCNSQNILESGRIKFSGILTCKRFTQFQSRRPVMVSISKEKILSSGGFCCSSRSVNKNERKQKDRQILESCQNAEKAVKHDGDGDTNNSLCARNSSQEF